MADTTFRHRMARRLRRAVSRLPVAARAKLWHAAHAVTYPIDFSTDEIALCEAVAPFTMTSPERVIGLRDAVRYVARNRIPGDIMECGVWRGGSMMVVASTLIDAGDTGRTLHLFDTFEGLPPSTTVDQRYDGVPADALVTRNAAEANVADEADVRANMLGTGYPADRIRLVRGDVMDTIPADAPPRIALMRLDTDWYDSTSHELAHLYPRLSPGGVAIIDDYGHWQGARKAVDEFLATLPCHPLLSRLDYTGRLWVKH